MVFMFCVGCCYVCLGLGYRFLRWFSYYVAICVCLCVIVLVFLQHDLKLACFVCFLILVHLGCGVV